MRESCTSGSVRGASSDRRLYSTCERLATCPQIQRASREIALDCPGEESVAVGMAPDLTQ